MRSNVAIRVNNVTKTYKLYDNHADRVKEAFHPFRKKYHRSFNALSDISFQVNKGETLGIIGRNGSGKSTLLQIICGILQTTSGSVEVNGRVSALLELGAGFNPEFTGRQNVYINASILGLKREEIDARIDDIVAFADIGDFLEQPVKSYSSGMAVRLAFAVAISIDPDILIVDEALAVGDEAFQRKCFVRIEQIQERGGTILFVSHGASTIVELCNRAIMLDQGELIIGGGPKRVVSLYHKIIFAPSEKVERIKRELWDDTNRLDLTCDEIDDEKEIIVDEGSGVKAEKQAYEKPNQKSFYVPELVPKSTVYYEKRGAIIDEAKITTLQGRQVNILVNGGEYIYTYTVTFTDPAFSVGFGMMIKTVTGFELGGATTTTRNILDYVDAGSGILVKFKFKCILAPGIYFLNAGVSGIINEERKHLHRLLDAEIFRVQIGDVKMVTGIVDFSVQPKLLILK